MATKRKVKSTPVFKVWIEIEEHDEANGVSTTLDAPGAALAVFDTYDEAWAFAERVTKLADESGIALDALNG